MVLIVSENNDLTTDAVIDWLHYSEIHDIVRINEDDNINIVKLDPVNEEILIRINDDKQLNLSEVSFFWFRRGNLNNFLNRYFTTDDVDIQKRKFLSYEWLMCRNYLFEYLIIKPSLGNYLKSATSKLINLKIAKACGFKVPKTLISSDQFVLSEFIKQYPVITKPISEAFPFYDNGGYYQMYTTNVERDFLQPSNKNIFPTLLQQKVEKHFEVRAFVLRKEIYAMAIFSQNEDQTSEDYRNYNFRNMNRMVPFELPASVKETVFQFMDKAGLDTGSIDLIKTNNDDYYFLEINPAGNIEMVSTTCNFNIEKRIAEIIKSEVNNAQ